MRTINTPALSSDYLTQFAEAADSLPGQNVAAIQQLRQQAFNDFLQQGLPSHQLEDWKYTRVQALAKVGFKLAHTQSNSVTAKAWATHLITPSYPLVFIDGILQNSPTDLPNGLTVMSIATALNQANPLLLAHLGRYASFKHGFIALNTAFMQNGVFIHVAAHQQVATPIQCLFIHTQTGASNHTRNLVLLEPFAKVCLIEQHVHVESNCYIHNCVTEVNLAAHAQLTHCKLIQESPQAFHVGHTQIQQAEQSQCFAHVMTLSGHWVRSDTQVDLAAAGANCTLNGIFLAKDQQHLDHHTEINHIAPYCSSREQYQGVLTASSRGIFNGKIKVYPQAQHTQAEQRSENLLLSSQAEIDTKPELEIYADDVKCSHGATVGQLADEALFYLRSRGLSLATAQQLLIYAFTAQLLACHSLKLLQDYLQSLLQTYINRLLAETDL